MTPATLAASPESTAMVATGQSLATALTLPAVRVQIGHQSAQKSTKTGLSDFRTISSKLASVNSINIAILLISSICATWLLISVAPKSDSVATQVINDFRNNKYEIYKTEIINSDTTYYYRLKQKE